MEGIIINSLNKELRISSIGFLLSGKIGTGIMIISLPYFNTN
jgi:lipid-binding SYLF domain-containing protein